MTNLKKVFFKKENYGYFLVENGRTINFGLENLMYALVPREDYLQMYVDYYDNQNRACVYLVELIKKYPHPEIQFRTKQETEDFDRAYDEYYDKRYEDMPRLKMSKENIENVKIKWAQVTTEYPNFLVFTLDDSGPLDVVDMYWSDELSKKDQDEMHYEHQKYLRWEKAFELYKKDHPFWWYSDYWYGPDDSFFESDLEPYYDRETSLLEKKKYTKKQIGLELKEKVKQKEYSQFLGKWFYQTLCNNIVDTDDHFNNLLKILYPMERYPEDMPSYEKLDEIADLIVAGRDDEIKLDF